MYVGAPFPFLQELSRLGSLVRDRLAVGQRRQFVGIAFGKSRRLFNSARASGDWPFARCASPRRWWAGINVDSHSEGFLALLDGRRVLARIVQA